MGKRLSANPWSTASIHNIPRAVSALGRKLLAYYHARQTGDKELAAALQNRPSTSA
jgi:hypothetical protein